jgi:predicted DNA-binding transcriptional regulator AlpA
MASRRKRASAPPRANDAGERKELLFEHEVTERTRLGHAQLWRLERANRFPKRRKIGFKRVAWRTTEVDAWIDGTWVPPSVASEGEAAAHA